MAFSINDWRSLFYHYVCRKTEVCSSATRHERMSALIRFMIFIMKPWIWMQADSMAIKPPGIWFHQIIILIIFVSHIHKHTHTDRHKMQALMGVFYSFVHWWKCLKCKVGALGLNQFLLLLLQKECWDKEEQVHQWTNASASLLNQQMWSLWKRKKKSAQCRKMH